MLWCRFYVNIDEVKGDYRPVTWPIKYPYWCSGESDEDFILVAYVDSLDDLYKQWPEAKNVESEKTNKIEFTSRFSKPDWYNPKKILKAEKRKRKSRKERFIEKFGHWWYLRDLDFLPGACEDYPKAFKMDGEWQNYDWAVYDSLDKAKEASNNARIAVGLKKYNFK